jgi:hypothetical protein
LLTNRSKPPKAASADRAGFCLSGLCFADQPSIIVELIAEPDVEDARLDWFLVHVPL